MASGKSLRPSMQAIKISSTPRFFCSIRTDSQNLVPSFSASHRSISSLLLDKLIHNATKMALLTTFNNDTVHENHWIDCIQRAVLPLNDFVNDSSGHITKRCRHINIIKLLNGFTNFASTHPFAVKGDDLIIKHSRSCLSLRNNLWKLPSRSLGTEMAMAPFSVFSLFLLEPFRLLVPL